MENFLIKIADTNEEFEAIHRLNYDTFVKEIPQHEGMDNQILIDKFHSENTYAVAKVNDKVVGMLAVRGNRPFSLDTKLDNLDQYLPPNSSVAELRLLTIKSEYRKTKLFIKLISFMIDYCLERNYNLVIISAIERELRFYKKMGFVPFHKMVGEEIKFQPMYVTEETYRKVIKPIFSQAIKKEINRINFLPGPPNVTQKAKNEFLNDSVSHRTIKFDKRLENTKRILCNITNANNCILTMGSGTLSNDMVAGGIKQLGGKGIIFVHGEFGNRLTDHARRIGLDFVVLEVDDDKEFTFEMQKEFIESQENISWLWTVHLETSIGYLYDIEKLVKLCKERSIELALDGCSSSGLVECDYKDVYLASTVSGKGLLSYSGLSIVFYREPLKENKSVSRYLDMYKYREVPFTFSSNQLFALEEALKNRTEDHKPTPFNIRKLLEEKNIPLLGDESYCKYVTTIDLPKNMSAIKLGDALKEKGVLISYESGYLMAKNRCQIVVLGNVEDDLVLEGIEIFVEEYQKLLNQ